MKKIHFLLTALLLLTLLSSCKETPPDVSTTTGGTEHTHEYITHVVPPSCIAEGYTVHTCIDCDHYYTDTPTAKVPHTYVDTVVGATCAVEGYTKHTCSVCGDSYNDTPTEKYDHVYYDRIVPPGCTEGGYTEHICGGCGIVFSDTQTPAAGHCYESVVVAPTGTAQGYTEHVCSVCGHSYRDSYTEPVERLVMATFRVEGGVMPEHPRVIYLYNTGTEVTLPRPTRDGYVFDGWYTEATEDTEAILFTDGIWASAVDVVLHAHWSPISVPLTLTMGEGGEKLPWSNPTTAWGSPIAGLPTPIPKFGYLFDGWFDGDTRITPDTVCYYTEPVTLTARFLAPHEVGTLTAGDGTDVNWAIDADGRLTFARTDTGDVARKLKLKLPERAFADRTTLVSVDIPIWLLLTDIGRSAFAGCVNLQRIEIPGSVEVVRTGVFEGCTSLTEVTLGSGIAVVNERAFAGCTSLTTLNVPLTLYQLYTPFEGCTSLATIRYEGTAFQWSVIVKDDAAAATLSSPGLQMIYGVAAD